MAVVRFYNGKPVKLMRRIGNGKIKLVFHAPIAGNPGRQQIVSQADWDRGGEKRTVPDADATGAALRRLAEST